MEKMTVKQKITKERQDLVKKQMARRMKRGTPGKAQNIALIGNKDHGVPFKGKDTFSGQFRKFEDRAVYDEETDTIKLSTRVTNKF